MKKNYLQTVRISERRNSFMALRNVFLICFLLLISFVAHSQTTVFLEPFNTSPLHANYSITKLDDGGSKVQFNSTSSPTHLQIYNDNGSTDGSGTNKRAYMTRSLTDLSSPFNKTLNQNAGNVTWTFNMRHSKGSITPHINGELALGDNNYAQLMVLVSSNADFLDATANGYAVTLTRDGSGTSIFKLVRFAAGLSATSNLTALITSTSGSIPGTNWASVKVAYAPATNTWSLYLRDDATTASTGTDKDPMDEAAPYTTIGSVVDATHTATEMRSFGFFANTGKARGGNNAKALYDNFGVQVGASTAASQESRLSQLMIDKLGGTDYVGLTKFGSNVYNYQYYLTKGQTIIPTISAVRVDTKASDPVITPASSLTGTQVERTATINITAEDGVTSSEYNIEFIKTDNIFLDGITASGSNTPPAGWASSSMYFATDNNGNERYQGFGYARCHSSSTSSRLTLPQTVSIGTLSFYAKKIDANFTGNIKISTKIDDGAWTVISDLGDINNLDYQLFTIPIHQQGAQSILIRLEITKQAGSAIYYFDDFAYTEPTFFRVNGSGSWNNANTWQTSTDKVNWQTSSVVPTFGSIDILNGQSTTVDAAITASAIIINPGAKLTLSNGGSLTTTNGIMLQNTAGATASFVDERTADNPPAIAGTVQQAISETDRNWYVAVPVSGKLASDITLSGAKIVQRNEALSSWDDVLAGNGLTPGVGYIAVASASTGTTTWSLNGNLNSGKVEVPVTRSGASSAGFNLLGNPYPSYLNWEQVLNLNATNESLLLPSIWYRTASFNVDQNKYDYTFNNYNSAGRVASPTSTSGYIPPMQAFWVRANSAGTVTFTNAMRSHGDGASNKLKTPKANTQQIIRLQIANEQAVDETVLYFNSNAQNTFDRFDTEKMFNNIASKPEIYSMVGTEKLVINGLSGLSQNEEFVLGYNYSQGGNLKIKVTELDNFDSNTKVYLLDKQENTQTELSHETEYAFNSPAISNNENRFSLLFRAPGTTTSTTNAIDERVSVFVNSQNEISIIAKPKSIYSIYNVVGQLIESGVVMNSELRTQNSKLAAGMYVVKVNSESIKVVLK